MLQLPVGARAGVAVLGTAVLDDCKLGAVEGVAEICRNVDQE